MAHYSNYLQDQFLDIIDKARDNNYSDKDIIKWLCEIIIDHLTEE